MNPVTITQCSEQDIPTICDIINESASAYKGVIPADRWHEPYMPLPELNEWWRGHTRFPIDLITYDRTTDTALAVSFCESATQHADTRSVSRGICRARASYKWIHNTN